VVLTRIGSGSPGPSGVNAAECGPEMSSLQEENRRVSQSRRTTSYDAEQRGECGAIGVIPPEHPQVVRSRHWLRKSERCLHDDHAGPHVLIRRGAIESCLSVEVTTAGASGSDAWNT
jgi:hypothetical protein